MNIRNLLAAYEEWRDRGADMVLATVYETAGSTYSKAGAQMLIGPGGHFQGMLSGGCLEGDLAERAARVIARSVPETVSYDLGQDDEALWGLGVGCDGLMRIFLQPLTAANHYQPFAAMAAVYRGDRPAVAVTVLEAGDGVPSAGGAALYTIDKKEFFSDNDVPGLVSDAVIRECLDTGTPRTVQTSLHGVAVTALVAKLAPPPRILVLGGGLDAEPLLRLMAELGWRIVVQDHRPAYIDKGNFDVAEDVLNCVAGDLASTVDFSRFDACIVMSHHLETDRIYLQQLAASTVPYIGLLGPVDRRRRLLASLGDRAAPLADRLHGPAGLDLGGRGPAAIALSIVAELHRVLVPGTT